MARDGRKRKHALVQDGCVNLRNSWDGRPRPSLFNVSAYLGTGEGARPTS